MLARHSSLIPPRTTSTTISHSPSQAARQSTTSQKSCRCTHNINHVAQCHCVRSVYYSISTETRYITMPTPLFPKQPAHIPALPNEVGSDSPNTSDR